MYSVVKINSDFSRFLKKSHYHQLTNNNLFHLKIGAALNAFHCFEFIIMKKKTI